MNSDVAVHVKNGFVLTPMSILFIRETNTNDECIRQYSDQID